MIQALRIALSTSLFLNQRLTGTHLAEVAAAGFRAIELVAHPSHFDYRSPAAVDELVGWLDATGVDVAGVQAPVAETFSLVSSDPGRRQRALEEAEAALALAERLRFRHLVIRLGADPGDASGGSDASARRSLEALDDRAAVLGVALAVENLDRPPWSVDRLVETVDALELSATGVCLDFGRAHRAEGVPDAIEAASGHLLSTHVYDVRARDERRLVPLDGEIDWPAALMALQKIGYDGRFVFDLGPVASATGVLAQAIRAWSQLESHIVG